MPEALQFPRPVVGAAARFYADQARRQVGKEGCHPRARELLE
jgi:hypothetical protein